MTREVSLDDHVLLVCRDGFFGEPDCPMQCSNGVLVDKMCKCQDSETMRYFGEDCSLSVAAQPLLPVTWVQVQICSAAENREDSC